MGAGARVSTGWRRRSLLAAGAALVAAPLAQWLDARGARLQWTAVA